MGLVDGWLGCAVPRLIRAMGQPYPITLGHSARTRTRLRLVVVLRWVPRPSLMLSDVLTTAKLSFGRRHTLVVYIAWEYVVNSITPGVNGAKFVIQGSTICK